MPRTPLFILGAPRSGTTLLAGLLARTSWGAPVETHFITKYYERARRLDLRHRPSFDRLARGILSERPVRQWKLSTTPAELYARCSRYDYAELVDLVCRARSDRLGNASWGDKTPHYVLQLPVLLDLFPDARYLYIVRDGRDVALSLLERPWGPATVYHCAAYWRRCNEPTEALTDLLESGRACFVKYEDLLADPRSTLEGIYDFLGEDWADDLQTLLEKVRSGNREKWRSRMSAREQEVFERVAASTLERFDYPTTHAEGPLPAFERALWATQNSAKHLRRMIQLNVIDTLRIELLGKEPFAE